MDGDFPHYSPRTVEQIFNDFKARRSAIVKALTSDVKEFYQQCDPAKENLCLYGHPNGQWQVSEPAAEVPTELPEPVLGINFARDGLEEREWLSLIAVHGDVWLLSTAFFIAARFGLGKDDRMSLFNMMQELPTVFEVVKAETKKQSFPSFSDKKPMLNFKGKQLQASEVDDEEDTDEDEDEDEIDNEPEETLCGACGETYSPEEFWICCDVCERWYHGNCVKITPARAEHIKHYKCPICNHKRGRA